MSFSSQWRSPHSPLRRFFDARFTKTRELRREWLDSVGAGELWWPYAADTPPPPSAIGTAFDYRFRLELGASFAELKGWRGLSLLLGSPEEHHLGALEALASWINSLIDANPSREERHLTKDCIVLAWCEEFLRAGTHINSPLFGLAPGADTATLLSLVKDTWVDDVQGMLNRVEPILTAWRGKPAVFGPSFVGSIDVGGADADLVVDGTLVELKTVRAKSPDRETLCQLAAYLLLDYLDQLKIRQVGICFGRWGAFRRWQAEEYLAKLSGDRVADLSTARRELQDALTREEHD